MTAFPNSHDRIKPIGNASPDESAHTPLAEPSHVTQLNKSPHQNSSDSSHQAATTPGTDEPQFALEPDFPSDGRDEIGEAMIRELPQRPELSEPPSQPSQTP